MVLVDDERFRWFLRSYVWFSILTLYRWFLWSRFEDVLVFDTHRRFFLFFAVWRFEITVGICYVCVLFVTTKF